MEEKQEGPHETDDVKTDNTSNSVDVSIKTKQKQTKNPPETDGIPVENRWNRWCSRRKHVKQTVLQ